MGLARLTAASGSGESPSASPWLCLAPDVDRVDPMTLLQEALGRKVDLVDYGGLKAGPDDHIRP